MKRVVDKELQELRVFYDYTDMDLDYREFINSTDCHQAHTKDMTARSGNWRIRWRHVSNADGVCSNIAGMSFERIQCDVRVDIRTMLYIMTRLRSPIKIEPMIVFHKRPWRMNYDQA